MVQHEEHGDGTHEKNHTRRWLQHYHETSWGSRDKEFPVVMDTGNCTEQLEQPRELYVVVDLAT